MRTYLSRGAGPPRSRSRLLGPGRRGRGSLGGARRPARLFLLPVGIGLTAGLAVGLAVLARVTPVYASSTSVLVASMGTEVNLRTEAELVRATETAADVFARLSGDPARPPGLGRLAAVEAVPGTSVLVITFEASTPAAAQAGAIAFAEVYLDRRAQTARADLDGQVAAVEDRLADVRTQLGGVTMVIGQLPPDSAELGSLRAAQESLAGEAASLTARLHELRTTTIDPGRVIEQAPLPGAPVRPVRSLWLGLAGAGGGCVGLVLHLLSRRWSRWVRQPEDLRRHRGVPVLAVVEFPDGVGLPAPHPGGALARELSMAFNRLRNEISAALAPTDRTLLLTGAAPGPASPLVAANLAAAFARADSDVVLVGANVPDLDEVDEPALPSLAALFDLADIPGLTDVLAGRTTLPRVVQPASRQPRLRVITPGGTASAGGLLQSAGAQSVLRALASRIRYVIVDAPSTASGADAQSLATAADAALLVVELGRTRHDQVADAVAQLARVGTRLLGAVVVARLTVAGPPEPEPARVVEAEVGARPGGLDEPTTKLATVSRWPLARERTARSQPKSTTPG